MTRRFVAIGIEPGVRAALDGPLRELRTRWPDHAWTDPEGWHVTLAFLGELPAQRRPEVVRGMVRAANRSAAGGLPRRLSLGHVERFDGRVLVLEVDDDPKGRVAVLGEAIQEELAAADLPVQRRPVRAHLTLARARRGRPVTQELLAATREVVPAGLGWPVKQVGLWSSHARRGPARYVVDDEVALPF